MFNELIERYISDNNYVKYSIIVGITVLFAIIAARIMRFILGRSLKKSSKNLNVDPTKYNFLKNGMSFVIYIGALIVIFYSIPSLKSLGVSLFAGAGIITAIILFASQQAFSNIISGIFIVIFKPFRVDDLIKVGELYTGYVEDITLRHTIIRNFENRRVIIPNSIISSETVINSTIKELKILNLIDFGISYDSDMNKAIAIIKEETENHSLTIDNRSQEDIKSDVPKVRIRVTAWLDSAVNIRANAWTKDHADGWVLKCDLYKRIKERFDNEGIEIPYPHRTIVYKKSGDE